MLAELLDSARNCFGRATSRMQQPLVLQAGRPDGPVSRILSARGVGILPLDPAAGDRYVLSERLAIQRKTAHEFINSIQTKELFLQAQELRENYQIGVVIVEGESLEGLRDFHPNAVRGALSSLVIQYGLSVLSSPSAEETAALVLIMARQEQIGIPEISLHPKRKALDLPDMQRRVVEMLPGVGRVLAKDLLRHFGTIEKISGASPQELRAVRELGPKKVARIRQVVATPYEDIDSEKDIEDAIAMSPEILFGKRLELVARQHAFRSESGEQGIADLIFYDPRANELTVVELKREPVGLADYRQLKSYLQAAANSALLRSYLGKGASIRGVLASCSESNFRSTSAAIEIRSIEKSRVLSVLRGIREAGGSGARPQRTG